MYHGKKILEILMQKKVSSKKKYNRYEIEFFSFDNFYKYVKRFFELK